MIPSARMLLRVFLAALLGGVLWACSENAAPPGKEAAPAAAQTAAAAPAEVAEAAGDDNPFFAPWDTPYGIPPFDRIRDEHYAPAFDRGIEKLRVEIAAIRDNPEPPDFANTFEALELAGSALERVSDTFGNIVNTDTNEFLQQLEAEINPRLTRELDAIYLDEKLFARIDAVYQQRATLGLDEQALRLVELTHLDFMRAGAALDAQAKARMKEINARMAELNTQFDQNVLKETNAFELLVTDPGELSGLPPDLVGSAKAKAEAKGRADAWIFGLDRGSYEGFMTFADQRDLRKLMYDAYPARVR